MTSAAKTAEGRTVRVTLGPRHPPNCKHLPGMFSTARTARVRKSVFGGHQSIAIR